MSRAFAGRAASSSGGLLEKGRVDVTRVKRYWRGRAPEWSEDNTEATEKEQERKTVAPVIVSKTVDPRLERLSLIETNKETVVPSHRRIKVSQETQDIPKTVKEEDLPSAAEHRAQLRLKLLETRNDEPALISESEEEEMSVVDSESDEEISPKIDRRPMMKPVFVSVDDRQTIEERNRLEEEEELEWEAQKQKLQQRIQDTREIVAQKIKEEDAALEQKEDGLNDVADIDTDDEEEDAEFDSWRQREMDRIKREKEELLAPEKAAIEREKFKNMTEEERAIYDQLNPKVTRTKIKKKWTFLQKYWHKGAYYQADPDDVRGTAGTDINIFNRDYSDPTGEDKMDKSMLPKVMQVKDFGRSGRTKWTHLVNEDTTDFNNPWTVDDTLRAKYNKRMAASEQEFQKPKRFRS